MEGRDATTLTLIFSEFLSHQVTNLSNCRGRVTEWSGSSAIPTTSKFNRSLATRTVTQVLKAAACERCERRERCKRCERRERVFCLCVLVRTDGDAH